MSIKIKRLSERKFISLLSLSIYIGSIIPQQFINFLLSYYELHKYCKISVLTQK